MGWCLLAFVVGVVFEVIGEASMRRQRLYQALIEEEPIWVYEYKCYILHEDDVETNSDTDTRRPA